MKRNSPIYFWRPWRLCARKMKSFSEAQGFHVKDVRAKALSALRELRGGEGIQFTHLFLAILAALREKMKGLS